MISGSGGQSRGKRSATRPLGFFAFALLGLLDEFLRHAVALQLRNMVDDGAQAKLTLPLNPPSDARFKPALPELPEDTTISASRGAKVKSPALCVTFAVPAELVDPS